jgi:hypothetical protein
MTGEERSEEATEEVRRLDISVHFLMSDEDEHGRRWVAEIGREDEGWQPELEQGWGVDPLSAVTQLAESLYAVLLAQQGCEITGTDTFGNTSIMWRREEHQRAGAAS